LVKKNPLCLAGRTTKIKDWTAGFEKQHFAASRGGKGTSTVEHGSTVQ